MGGKTQASTQKVQIPKEVMARYTAVNKRAEDVAGTPFQQYSSDPNAFVAPMTGTQQQAIQNIQNLQGSTSPYYAAGAGMTMAGAGAVNPEALNVGQYYNPFTQAVADPTYRALMQQQQEQMQGATGNAIKSGAFGGDRAGIVAANLARQQQLGMSQAMNPIYQQAYQQALQTAQQQQGVNLSAEQANQLRLMQGGQQIAGLGAQQQQTGLAAAQALMGAGTAEQQTQQAGLQALYNQFQQGRAYPFQVAQFLANIAMGTGALSGSTTTTQQPAPFFSDRRLKHDVERVGHLDDGQPIYRFKYNGDDRTQLGLMAQDVEKHHPEAVGLAGGYKTVDYERATDDAAHHAVGGSVYEPGEYDRGGFAGGGLAGSEDMRGILAATAAPIAFYGGSQGLYGGAKSGPAGGGGYLGMASNPVAVGKLVTAGGLPQAQKSGMAQAIDTASQIQSLAKMGQGAYELGQKGLAKLAGPKPGPSRDEPPAPMPASPPAATLGQVEMKPEFESRGGIVPHGYAAGGMPYGDESGDDLIGGVVRQGEKEVPKQLQTPGQLPKAQQGLGGELIDMAKTGASLYGLGSAAASGFSAALPFLAMLSDRRAKHDVEHVGELYDGQPVYRFKYNGDNRTQLGLMAQDAERNGHGDAVYDVGGAKMLDYKRATDVAVGLAPRHGYATRGEVVDPADLPAADAIEIAGVAPPVPSQYMPLYEEAEKRTGIPKEVLIAKDYRESRMKPGAVGKAGEIGLGQIMPSTARDPGFGVSPVDTSKLTDPRTNVLFGADYLAGRGKAAGVKDWNDPSQVARGLAAYNAGGDPNYVANVGKFLPTMDLPGSGSAGRVRVAGLGATASDARQPGGVVPPEEIPSRSPWATLFGDTVGGGREPKTKQALASENLWIPALAGIGSMLASKSPYLASAVGEGLVGGTKAYTDLAKQQGETDEAKARTALTGVQAAGASIKYDARGFPQSVLVPDKTGRMIWVPFYEVINNPSKYPLGGSTRAELEEAARRAGIAPAAPTGEAKTEGKVEAKPAAVAAPAVLEAVAAPTAPAAPAAPAEEKPTVTRSGAIEVESGKGGYNVHVTPQKGGVADQYFQSPEFRGVGTDDPMKIQSVISTNPNLAIRQDADTKNAEEIRSRARSVDRNITDLQQLVSSINKIGDEGFTQTGYGQETRAQLVKLFNTTARVMGAKVDPLNESDAISQTDIIRKIQGLSSPAIAEQSGFRAASIADAIRSALPSGNISKDAANTLIASMMVELQRDRDFNRYYDSYTRKYGTALGVYDNFNREMGDRYQEEKQRLKPAFVAHERTDTVDGKPVKSRRSYFDVLIKNPKAASQFDKEVGVPGIARYGKQN